MSDGSDNPTEMSIDESNGLFTLENEAAIKTTYVVDISILTSDGTNEQLLSVEGLRIKKICGLRSTTLIPPVMGHLDQAPNLAPPLSIYGVFETTNSNCPVTGNELLTS